MSGQELPFPSVNLQEDEKKVEFQQSQEECVSVPSTLQEGSACNQPYSDGKFAFDEENVASAVDGACGCSHTEEDEIPTGLPENQNDHGDMKGPEVVAPRFSRQLPQMRENGVPRDSPDEYYLTYSVLPGLSDSFWPYRSNAIFSLEDVDVSYAQDVPNNENYHKPMSGQELPFPSVNLQEDEKKVEFQQSQEECVSVPSTLQEGSACNQPYSDGKFAFDEENVASAVDGACGCSHTEEDEIPTGLPENQNDHGDMKGPEVVAPRFSRQLPQMRENGVPRDSPDEYYLTYSVLPGLSDSFWPYRSNAIFSLEDVDVSYARDVPNNENYHKPMSGQELPFPSVNLQEDEKKVEFQQSQEECVSVPSTLQEGSACNQPYSDGKFAFDEENVASAVDGACGCSHTEEDEIPTGLPENQNDHGDMKGPEVVAPRFSRQLPQMRENGVPRDSPDEYYLTYSVLPGLSDSFWPYRSNAIFSLEDVDVSYARDVPNNENYHKPMSGQELPFPSVNLQEDEKKVEFQQSQEECVSVPSTLQEGSACNQPYSDGKFAFDEENVASAVDGACGCSRTEEDEIPTGLPENQNDHGDMKGPEVVAPRFSRQLPQMRENGVSQVSPDEYYLTYSVLPGLSDSFWPYRSNAIFSLEDVDVSCAQDLTKNLADLKR
uniref:Olduvai domain-containing protein n=1 Tax=Capra hircus TaxID=9925 RepID=A0A452FV76_CAPHI